MNLRFNIKTAIIAWIYADNYIRLTRQLFAKLQKSNNRLGVRKPKQYNFGRLQVFKFPNNLLARRLANSGNNLIAARISKSVPASILSASFCQFGLYVTPPARKISGISS